MTTARLHPPRLIPLETKRSATPSESSFLPRKPARSTKRSGVAREADCPAISYPALIEAAADDLAAVAAYLDFWADSGGDGPARHEIHLAAAVLDAGPVLAGLVGTLRAEAQKAREAAPADSG